MTFTTNTVTEDVDMDEKATIGCALLLFFGGIIYTAIEAALYIRALWNLGGL